MTTRLPSAFALLLLLTPAAVAEVPIGSAVGALRFKDSHFLPRTLAEFGDRSAYVVAFIDSDCPLVRRYLPVLKRLEAEYRARGVQFVAVHTDPDVRLAEAAGIEAEYALDFPVVKDIAGKCVAATGVERTPEVAVLDAKFVLRYRGRIDDQYRAGGTRAEPTRHDLRAALDELLAGTKIEVESTVVDGCLIVNEAPKDDRPATFSEHVAPILFTHCAGCHRPDGGAPFALLTYADAKRRAKAIAEVVSDGQMPPWFSAPGYDKHFTNKAVLSASERGTIARWVRTGMPEGDPAKLPAVPNPPSAKDGWRIGEPDLVLETAEYDIPAEGDVPYQHAVLPHVFWNETWLTGVQIKPDDPAYVHHCNMAYASLSKQFDMQNFVTGYVPGGEPMRLYDGVAYRVPKLSAAALQIHFVTNGKPAKTKLKVGLKFASGVVRQQLRCLLYDSHQFLIPPHAAAHRVSEEKVLDCNAVGIGMFSHMHLRGKVMSFAATPPGGDKETLLVIPNYHFEWQIPYRWASGARRFPKGTKVECAAVYDNSKFNAFNPGPDKPVRWGEQTRDEMMNGFLFYVDADEDLKLDVDGKTGAAKKK